MRGLNGTEKRENLLLAPVPHASFCMGLHKVSDCILTSVDESLSGSCNLHFHKYLLFAFFFQIIEHNFHPSSTSLILHPDLPRSDSKPKGCSKTCVQEVTSKMSRRSEIRTVTVTSCLLSRDKCKAINVT